MAYNLVVMFLGSIVRNVLFLIFEFRIIFEPAVHYVLSRLLQKVIGVQEVEIEKSEKLIY